MSEAPNRDIKNFIIGAVVGTASILPGVSGGLIAVLCGIYERLIDDLSDLRHKLFSDFRFLFMLGLGLLIGMLGCTLILDYTMEAYLLPCMALFFGLIVAQIPEVYKLTGYENGTKPSVAEIIWLIAGLTITIVLMFYHSSEGGVNPEDHSAVNMLLFFLCGVIVAISKVMPGISGSSLLIALGLFEVTVSSIADLDLYFILPLGVGLVVGVLGFAKVMKYCIDNYRPHTYMMIMGLTIGSLLIILQEIVFMDPNVTDIVICIVMAVLGVAISYGFTLYGKRLSE